MELWYKTRRVFTDVEEAISREIRRILFFDQRTPNLTILQDSFDPFTGEPVRIPIEPNFYDSSADSQNIQYPNFFVRLLKAREDRFTNRIIPEYSKNFIAPITTSPRAYHIITYDNDGAITLAGNTFNTSIYKIKSIQAGNYLRLLSGNNIGTYIISSVIPSNTPPHSIIVSNTLVQNTPSCLFNSSNNSIVFTLPIDLNTVQAGDVFIDASSTHFTINSVDIGAGSLFLTTGTPNLASGGSIIRNGNVFKNVDSSAINYIILDQNEPLTGNFYYGQDNLYDQQTGTSSEVPIDAYYLVRIDSKERESHIEVLNRMWEEFNPPRTALPVIIRSQDSAEQLLTRNSVTYTFPPLANQTSLFFDGINQQGSVGNNYNFEYYTPWSWSFWINTSTISYSSIISSVNANLNNGGYRIAINSSGQIEVLLISSSGFSSGLIKVASISSINDGNWHNIVISYSGTSLASGISIFKDGINLTTTVVSDNLTSSMLTSNSLTFASDSLGGNYFKGNLDEISIYNTNLSLNQAIDLYNLGTPTDVTLLESSKTLITSWWRMGDLNDNSKTIYDQIGNITLNLVNMNGWNFSNNIPSFINNIIYIQDTSGFNVGDSIVLVNDFIPTKNPNGNGFERPFSSTITNIIPSTINPSTILANLIITNIDGNVITLNSFTPSDPTIIGNDTIGSTTNNYPPADLSGITPGMILYYNPLYEGPSSTTLNTVITGVDIVNSKITVTQVGTLMNYYIVKINNPTEGQLILQDAIPDIYTVDSNTKVISNSDFHTYMFHFVDHVTKDIEGSQYWVHEFTFWVQLWVNRLERPITAGSIKEIIHQEENL